MNRSTFLAATAGIIASTSLALPARADDDAVRSAISATLLKYDDALKRGDASVASSIFASDATIIAPGIVVVGHEAIVAYYVKRLATRKYIDGSVTTTSVAVAGDMASELGTFTFIVDIEGQPRTTVTGRYLTTWRKQKDRSWLISADAVIPDPPPKT